MTLDLSIERLRKILITKVKSDRFRDDYTYCPLPKDIKNWNIKEIIRLENLKELMEDRLKHLYPELEENDFYYSYDTFKDGVPYSIYYDTVNKVSVFPCDITDSNGNPFPYDSDNFAKRHWYSGWYKNYDDSVSLSNIELDAFLILSALRDKFREKGIDAYIISVRGGDQGMPYVKIDEANLDKEEKLLFLDFCLWVYYSKDEKKCLFELI